MSRISEKRFVVFNVEYRGGRLKDASNTQYTSVQQQLAVYRACQDARGAIRSIIKRQKNQGTGDIADSFRINTSKIFVGGFSAGGVAAMNASWYTNSMVYAVFPNGGTGSLTIQQALGSIDIDQYYASNLDVPNYQDSIIGNACMWSIVSIPYMYENLPYHEYDFFSSAHLKPLISFQGKLDDVFPYDTGQSQYVYFEPPPGLPGQTNYNSESECINGTYFLESGAFTVDQVNGSTLNMRYILQHYNIADEHYVDLDMHHGIKSHGIYDGDFCSGAADETGASIYIASRIACFFQAILNNIQSSLGTDYFPNCKNERKACNAKTTSCPTCQ